MSEEKARIHARVTEETERKIEAAMVKANCRSRNEFLGEALQFYCDYLATKDVANFLPPIFIDSMRATILNSETRICRLLFKLTVEISMMMHVLAEGLEINNSQLDALRWRCVQEVKKTNGSISFKETLEKSESEDWS